MATSQNYSTKTGAPRKRYRFAVKGYRFRYIFEKNMAAQKRKRKQRFLTPCDYSKWSGYVRSKKILKMVSVYNSRANNTCSPVML